MVFGRHGEHAGQHRGVQDVIWRILLALFLLCVARPALAQTTFGSDCNSNLTISGAGLILTADASSTYRVCRADNPKFSGKWYFTYTPSVLNAGVFIGVASGATLVPYGGLDPATCTGFQFNTQGCGSYQTTASVITSGGGGIFMVGNNIITGTGSSTVGVRSVVAVDLDTDPPQYWFTPDASGTSGYSGGPLWNGSSSSSPEVPGTGLPTSGGTGAQFILKGQLQNPVAVLANSDAVTFSFAAYAPITTLLPDYSPWNTSGGGPPSPGPLTPMNSQISNAPGWTSGTRAVGYRVNAGPGWNGTSYTSGSKLCLFAVTVGGTTGSDPTVFNTACNSGTPAGVGGIPTGSWGGATTVTDGSVTWALLTVVDEVTATAAPADTNTPWATSTQYLNGAYVLNGGVAYVQTSQALDKCTSASSGSGPTGISFNGGITDNTCSWASRATIVYSSHNAMPGHQFTYNAGGINPEISIFYDINFNLWWGGTGAPKYQAGHGNENDPVTEFDITDLYGEGNMNCWHGLANNILPNPTAAVQGQSCNGQPWLIRYRPAPGDGFADNAPTGPLGYGDSSKGVMVYSNTAVGVGINPTGSAMLIDSFGLVFQGLQVFSVNGAALGGNINGITSGWTGHVDNISLVGNILYAGGQNGPVSGDGGTLAINNVFVYAGSDPICYGLFSKFESTAAFNTFIGPGLATPQCAAILDLAGAFYNSVAIQKYDNAIFGFGIPYVYSDNTYSHGAVGASNVTDVAASYTGSSFTYNAVSYTGTQMVGTSVNSASGAATFVNPTVGASLDLRVKNASSPLYGAGVTFSNNGSTPIISLAPWPPTVDIYNNLRPTGSRFDVGSEQFQPGVVPTVLRLRLKL